MRPSSPTFPIPVTVTLQEYRILTPEEKADKAVQTRNGIHSELLIPEWIRNSSVKGWINLPPQPGWLLSFGQEGVGGDLEPVAIVTVKDSFYSVHLSQIKLGD